MSGRKFTVYTEESGSAYKSKKFRACLKFNHEGEQRFIRLPILGRGKSFLIADARRWLKDPANVARVERAIRQNKDYVEAITQYISNET